MAMMRPTMALSANAILSIDSKLVFFHNLELKIVRFKFIVICKRTKIYLIIFFAEIKH